MVQRAKIILLGGRKLTQHQIATQLEVRPNTVSTWIRRWRERSDLPIEERLADAERSGTPPKFTPEQACRIIALACEKPSNYQRPITHWTARELRDQTLQEEIVPEISLRQVGRLLKEYDLQPHRMRYYLTDKVDPQKQEKIEAICEVYLRAQAAAAQGEVTFSVDEKTGIQALERIAPDKPMKPGQLQRIEFEYKRHGTLCLLAGLDVATGEIQGFCQGTRTETDFLALVDHLIQSRPQAPGYQFVVDSLNTHWSESMVRYVAEICGYDPSELGRKGHSGILKNEASRVEFLTRPEHQVRFYYTPKHASWMNQIECWFGILVRKLIRRGSFVSLADLQSRIQQFIDYFNRTMAKPMKWIYSGKPATT